MGGGLMQLVAYGAQDIYLTGNPQITFFKVVYRRHTNFSMESIKQTFDGELPPYAMEVEVSIDGTEVAITWEGAANEWAVLHNGEVIGITSSNSFRHSPTMEGTHTYNVIPIVDGQQIQWNSEESTDTAELNSNNVPEKPGPSETAGMIFSIILLLVGIIGVALSFIPRRD